MGKYKRFIKKIFDDELTIYSSNDLKGIIKAEFPGEFQEHKVGDWIWVKSDKFLGRQKLLIYFNGYDKQTYGFNEHEEWGDSFNNASYYRYGRNLISENKTTKATVQSVRMALTVEANKRGFVEGAVAIPVRCKEPQTIKSVFNKFSTDSIIASSAGEGSLSPLAIYYFGKWATLVEGEMTLEREFKDKDMVEIIANRTFHKILIGTICELEKNHTDDTWFIWHDGSRHVVVESDIKHVN